MTAPPWDSPGGVAGDLPGLAALPATDLATLAAAVDVHRRFDRKYVVEVASLDRLIAGLGPRVGVLEVGGRPSSDCTTTYFDTPDLRTYRDHAQGRRRRFKIRTRHYGDPVRSMLEIKTTARRGATHKHRWAHPGGAPDRLGADAELLIGRTLGDRGGSVPPDELAAVAVTRFARVTLVDLDAAERVTIDLGLSMEANGRRVQLDPALAVVEVKAPRPRAAATADLEAMGFRPDRVSKYCIAIAATHDGVRGTAWLPVLRRVQAPVPR